MEEAKDQPLAGKVAVVAGATRHSGRGIAIELGSAGATVYCTGRSIRGKPSPRNDSQTIEGKAAMRSRTWHGLKPLKPNELENIEETAEMVDAYGGKGIWVQVDHTDIDQVDALFQLVWREHGRLDLVVNSITGGAGNEPFLKSNLASELCAIDSEARCHIITAHVAARRMVEAKSGLIISISDHEWDQFYAMDKAIINRIALSVADELRPHGVAILSLLPGGFFRCFDIMTEDELRRAVAEDPEVLKCHTPRLIGRGVVALATDTNIMSKSGKVIDLHDLIPEYGFSDIDGRQTGEMW